MQKTSVALTARILLLLDTKRLKYNNKDKPKPGQRPGPRLNYDVKIGLKPQNSWDRQGSSDIIRSHDHSNIIDLFCHELRTTQNMISLK